jgi:hypothetical protein
MKEVTISEVMQSDLSLPKESQEEMICSGVFEHDASAI